MYRYLEMPKNADYFRKQSEKGLLIFQDKIINYINKRSIYGFRNFSTICISDREEIELLNSLPDESREFLIINLKKLNFEVELINGRHLYIYW